MALFAQMGHLMTRIQNNLPAQIIATMVVIASLIYFSDLLTPLALAIFLWLIIDGAARLLSKKLPFIKRRTAVPITLLLVFLGLAFVVAFVAEYAKVFAHDISTYNIRLNEIIAQIYAQFTFLGPAPTIGDLFNKVSPTIILSGLGDALTSFGAEALFVLIYVICLFAAQASMPHKIVNIFPDKLERDRVMNISSSISKSMEQYLWVQTVTGIMIALACYVVFVIAGLKNSLFWALITFLLSYIPAVGAVVASIFPALFALVQFATPIPAVIIFGATQTIQFVIGNVILPRMTGDSLNLSAIMVFLSLAFWGKIWGGPGMFLAVPLTVMMMIILAQFESTKPLAIMMSANGTPYPQPPNSAKKRASRKES
jgi:predicted PurR-regulated permease PerM